MGAPLETVTVQHESAKAPREVRISKNVKRAIDLMVFDALKRPDAAQRAGLTDHALYVALRQSHVLAYLNAQQRVLRTSAAARSIARIDKLADESESDHVKLQSNVFLLGIEGVQPVQRTENIHHLSVQVPGLCIMIAPREHAPLIHDQSHEAGSHSPINSLPPPVPHPSMRNAIETSYREIPEPSPVSAGVGENS